MIIKELYIKNFGKIKDKKIGIKEGFNIVYGENEAGKSTLQGFIKSMLYGLTTKRGKDIRGNERVRFLPFTGEKASGELLINHDNEEIIIQRFFGYTKKDDESKIINNLTGEEFSIYPKDEPGKGMLGINGESFNNTLFIKQLGSGVNTSKEDELINKIANTLESGEEGISYQKVKLNLEEARKGIVTARKGGKLDLLKVRYHNLLDEKHKKLKLNEENIDNELKLIDLRNHREFLNKEIDKLEIAKKYLKKIKLESEYKEITNYLMKSESLKEQKQQVDGELKTLGAQVSEDFLLSLKEEARVYFNLLDLYEERQKELESINNVISEKINGMDIYGALQELPDNMQEKILKLSLEEESLKENYALVTLLKDELKLLKHKAEVISEKINNHKISMEDKDDIESNLNSYEEKLRDIKITIGDKKLDFGVTNKLILIENKIKIYNILFLSTIGGGAVSVYNLISADNKIPFIILGALTIGGLIFSIVSRRKYSMELEGLKEDKSIMGKINVLKQEIILIEQNLSKYTDKVGARGYEEFILLVKDYNNLTNELDQLEEKISEKKDTFNTLKGEEIISKVNKNSEIKEKLLRVTGCITLDGLLDFVKEYSEKNNELDILSIEKREKENSSRLIKNDLDAKEEFIKGKLSEVNLQHIDLHTIFEEIDKITEKIHLKNQLEQSLKSTEEGYKLLLKNRDVEDLEDELKDFIINTDSFSYENEDEIELEIKDKNNDLLNTEKEIKDVEHTISKSMIATRNLSVIDEDINIAKDEINRYEKQLKSIDIALRVLDESFKEIQKSFGPVLNNKVSEIFSELTNGEYNEVKVSEHYELVVRSTRTNSLVNISHLSNGTCDQVYLALRLAIIQILFKNENVPIILDESFSQYDDKRLEVVLDMLYEISKHKQIILFTCQKREIELLKDKEDINLIKI